MKFEMPKLTVEEFEVVDVIMTASFEEGGDEGDLGKNETDIV